MNRLNIGIGFLLCTAGYWLCGLASVAAVPESCLEQKILPEAPWSGERFGQATAMDGATAVIGSRETSASGYFSGSAHVLELTGESWSPVKILDDPISTDFDDRFGNAVAVDGETIAIADRSEDIGCEADPFCNAGAVYIFNRDEGGVNNWGLAQTLVGENARTTREFGASIALSEDVLVVGTPEDSTAAFRAGSASVFHRVDGIWVLAATLMAAEPVDFDRFGAQVAVAGTTIVVGARWGAAGLSAGSAYVFERDQDGPDAWGQVIRLEPKDAEVDQSFGSAVAINGNTIVIGAHADEHAGSFSGAAYVFERAKGTWEQTEKLVAFDAAPESLFGSAVGVSGDLVIVGAYFDQGADGSAYVFERRDGEKGWPAVRKLTGIESEPLSFFGFPVTIGGTSALVSATWDDDAGPNAGAVYSFDLAACTTCGADVTFDGTVDVLDLVSLITAWNQPGGPADINLDGLVDVTDLVLLIKGWGACE